MSTCSICGAREGREEFVDEVFRIDGKIRPGRPHSCPRLRPLRRRDFQPMKIKVVVHEAEDGGYWAEVPSIPGCATQGESFEELLANLYEAVKGCLSVDVQDVVVS